MLKAERKRVAIGSGEAPGIGRQDMRRYLKLIPLDDASQLICSKFRAVGSELVPADRSLGRVSASVVLSQVDIPGVSTCAMDGYAVRSEETAKASQSEPSRFRVRAYPGGANPRPSVFVGRGEALFVSTGDPIPAGADAVVRVEETRRDYDTLLVARRTPKGRNVSSKAEDLHAGQILVTNGEAINAACEALLMSAGIAEVRVFREPRVGVLSVGSDLKSFRDISPGKKTNNYANLIVGYLSDLGVEASMLGIAGGDVAEIRARLEDAVREFDMVLAIGGVSVGPNDLTPDAAVFLGDSEIVFHGLRVVPLRPVGVASVSGKPVVMIPGHAVSAALCLFVVVVPTLNIISGLPHGSRRATIMATAAEEFSNKRPIDALVLATLQKRKDGFAARPLGWGSNLLSNLSKANGFVHLKPGERVRVHQTLEVELLGSSELTRFSG